MNANEIIILIVLVNAFLGVFIYFDASKNKIGKIKNDSSMLNMSAVSWSSIGLLQMASPIIYLFARNHLIKKAKESPATEKYRNIKIILIVVAYIAQSTFFISMVMPK